MLVVYAMPLHTSMSYMDKLHRFYPQIIAFCMVLKILRSPQIRSKSACLSALAMLILGW